MNRAAKLVAALSLLLFGVLAPQGMIQAQASNKWTSAGQLTQARTGAAAVLLADGRLLITGGTDGNGVPQATAEVCDPTTGTFTAVPAMNVPRANHAAIVLENGDVLVTGGLTTGGSYSDSAEIYGVKSQQWTLLTSSIGVGLSGQSMATLSDGNILIAGGSSTAKVVGSIVLFSLTDKSFTPIGTLLTARTNAVAAATPDGRVLIAGGADIDGAVLASTEIFVYDKGSKTGTVSAGPIMASPRVNATATTTYDGVAIIGGNNGQIDLGTAEIFSQWTNKLKLVSGGTPRSGHFAALLPKNGSVLVTGGTGGSAVDLLEPWANSKAGAFVPAANSPINQDGGFASPLTLGSVLTGGGKGDYARATGLYWFPTISTDKFDYAPGTPVHMTGTGFQPLETVTLHIHEWVKQSTDDDPDVTVTANSSGNFIYSGYAPDTDDIGARYHLTAVGMSSGYQAQVIFHDSIQGIGFANSSLNLPVAPATGTATAAECGQLMITVGGSAPFSTIYVSSTAGTGSFYSSQASCLSGSNKITQITTPTSLNNVWYRDSAAGSPTVTACTVTGGQLTCEFEAFLGAATFQNQLESIYGTASQISFLTEPIGGAPGVVWGQQPLVAVQDANYNTIGSNTDPISLTITTNAGAGTLTCSGSGTNGDTFSASSGLAAFSGCKINNASTSCYVIKATDTANGFSATSSCFYISNPANAGKSTVVANPASPTTVADNGTATSTITVTLKDVNGNAVSGGKTVNLSANNGSSTISNQGTGVTNSSGVVTFTVTDTSPEVVIYSATDATDGVLVTQTASVTFAAGQVNAGNSSVTRSPATVNADGVSFSTITVTLNDSSGDNIVGETVTLGQAGGHSVITPASAVTDANGVATFKVTDTTAEAVTYTASYSGSNGSGSLTTHTVTVTFQGIPTTLTLTVNPNNTTFGTSPIVLTSGLSVTSGGAPLSGVTISFFETYSATGTPGTCSTSSTPVGTATTDSGGTAALSWITTTLAAGNYRICASTPTPSFSLSSVTYNAASSSQQTLTVAGAATTLTWTAAPPASANYNAQFTVTATSNSCGTISYAVSGGCSLSNGNRVTMTSGTNACQVSATVAARVCSGTQYGALTIGPVSVTANTIAQSALSVRPVSGTVADGASFTLSTTGGNGTGAVTFATTTPTVCSVNGTTLTMTATGTGQACTVTASKASDGNYAATALPLPSATYTSNGNATVTITNTTQGYTGSPLPVTVVTSPPGLTVLVTYANSGTTTTCGGATDPNCPTQGPTLPGKYSVTATITSGGTGSATATETVNQTSAGLTLSLNGNSSSVSYGTMAYFYLTFGSCTPGNGPTGTVTLIVDGNPAVAGSGGVTTGTPNGSCAFVFNTATIEPSPDAHNVSVQFSGDSGHLAGASNTLLFLVSADATSVNLAATATSIDAGGSVTFTATVVPAGVDQANGPQGTVQFYVNGGLVDTQPLTGTSPYTAATTYTFAAAGSYSVVATYVPGTDLEFAGSSSVVNVTTVKLIPPTITWAANPQQPIGYGTPLNAVQLAATATDPVTGNTVTGTFAFSPGMGSVLHAGPQILTVTFTPDVSESTIYSSNTASESITVNPAPLTVIPDSLTMVYGAAVPGFTYTFSGLVGGDVPNQVTGTAQCSITGTTPYTVSGSPYPITCSQGTLVEADYTFSFATGSTLTVTTATPKVTLLCPEVTYDGATHTCQGLAVAADGTTPVAGNWGYNPGSEIAQGNYSETGTFTASDSNYTSTPQTANATLIIDKATSSVTFTCPSFEPYNGTAWTPCTALATGAGGLSTDVTSSISYQNNTNPGTASVSVSYIGDANHTGSSNQTTFAIAGAPITASAGGGSFTYNGGTFALSACQISAPSGGFTGGLTCTNNPDPVGPNVTLTPQTVTPVIPGTENTSGFTITYVPTTYTISPATPTVTITCPVAGVVYNGTAQKPCTAAVTGPGGLNQDLTASISYGSNTNFGTATASVSYAGGGNYASVSSQASFPITAEPVTATAGSLNGAVYTGSAQAIPACVVAATPPNTYTAGLSCTNNPASETDFGSGIVTPIVSGNTQGNFQVTQVNGNWSIGTVKPTVTVNCPTTVIYSGTAQTPCTAVVTGPGNPPQTVTWAYTPQNTNVGPVTATANFAAVGDYAASTGQGSFQITQAAATITTLNNTSQYFTGLQATAVTANTLPSGLTYSVLYGTTAAPTNPTSSTPPSAAGSYAVLVTITDPNYAGSKLGTLVISAAPTTISLTLSGASNPANYGTNAIFDLNLPIVGSTCPTGTVTWVVDGLTVQTTTLSGASCSAPPFYQTNTLAVGTHKVSATYSGDSNYQSGGASLSPDYQVGLDTTTVSLIAQPGTVTVGQGVTFIATITLAVAPGTGNPALAGTVNILNLGNTIGSTTTLAQISPTQYLATVTYTGLAAGTYQISAAFVPGPGVSADYAGSSSTTTVQVNVNKANPVITWNTPANIVYGTALSGTQLNATAANSAGDPLGGSFAYSPAALTVLNAGQNQPLNVTFTPNNTTNYSTQTQTVLITVLQATPTISISDLPVSGTYGGSFTATYSYSGNGTPTESVSSSTTGVCTVSGNTVNYVGIGTCTLVASATATTNYTAVTGNAQSFTVGQATPTISISDLPVSGTYGGSFTATYSYSGNGTPTETVSSSTTGVCTVSGNTVNYVGVGTCTLRASATATTDYTAVTGGAQSFTVSKATPTINISDLPASGTYGGSFTATYSYSGNGTPTETVSSSTTGVCTVSGNTVNYVGIGTCTLTASATATTDYAAVTGSPQSFTVLQATPTISISDLPVSGTYGGSFTATYSYSGNGTPTESVSSSTTGVCTVSGNTVSFVGIGTCTLTASATATANYTAVTGNAQSFAVGKATPTISISNIPSSATYGGSFTATYSYSGNGTPTETVSSSTTGVCTVSGNTVNYVGAGTCTLTASATATTDYTAVTGGAQSFTVNKATPTISISDIPSSATYGGSFTATYSYSGNGTPTETVSSSTTGVCTVSGNTVSYVGAGTCTLTASATATANYAAVTGGPQSFTVGKATPTITISDLPASGVYGGSFTATYSYSGNGSPTETVSSSTTGVCTVSGNTVNYVGLGTCTLTASATATANYAAVTGSAQSFTVGKATPTISISDIPSSATYGGSFTATYSYSGNGTPTETVSSSTTGVCTVSGNTVSYVGVGTCTLTASATATTDYTAVTGSPQSFTVNKATPTISISDIPSSATYGGSFTATYSYSGNGTPTEAVSSSTTGVCTVSGNTVSYVGAGTCTLTASATATTDYAAVTGSPQSFTVGQATPTISISNLPASGVYGGSFTATYSYSGNGTPTETVSSSTIGVCTVSGNTVSYVGIGTCTLTPSATATTDYAAVTGSPQSFTVGQATPTISISNLPASGVYGGSFTATYSYSGNGSPTETVLSSTTGVCTVSGNTVNYVGVGTCTLRASATATADFAAVTGNAQSFTVSPASPTISISDLPASGVYGGSFTATYSYSGNGTPTETVSSSTIGVCTVSGNTVRYVGIGTCTLTASATATADYAAATGSAQSFTVSQATLTVTANNLSLTVGSTIPTLTATITGLANGDSQATAVTGTASCTTTATSASPAGTYPINCTAGTLAAANYTFTFVSGTLTLNNKTTPTVSVWPTASPITYGQTLASSTLTPVTAAVPGNASVAGTFAWTTSTTTPGAGTDLESVTFTPTNTTDYNTVTNTVTVAVSKATPTVTLTCPANVSYNGAAQTPCTATVTGAGGLSQSLTVTYSNNTNAGTANANASFAGDANYSAGSNSTTFDINTVAVTATAGSYSGTADGSAHSPSACSLVGAFTGGLTCTNNPASVGPAVGSGTVTPVVSGSTANFTITSVNGTWSITQAALTPTTTTVICPASVGFNGLAQTPCTATVTGAGGLNQSLTVSYNNNTNAGTASANASFAGDTTYASSTNSATFTISPVAVTATAGSYSGTADGSAHSPSACLLTGAYTLGLACTNNPASVGPAVGSGTVTPVVTGGSANFVITPVNGSWSITQGALTPTTTTVLCPTSVGFNGAAQTPCTATVTGAGGLSQSLTVSYINNTNAGTATANASFAGNTTYASSTSSATFTINPVAVTATAGSYSGTADGSAHSPSACLLTGAYTLGLACTNNPASVGPAVGSGTVTPVVTGGSSNFNITPVNGSWSITQGGLTPTTTSVICPASVGYNGAAQTPCTATVTGAGGLNQSLTVSYANNTNAGTASANASFAGDTTYASSSNSTTFTITQALATVTLSNLTQNYTGSPLPATVTTTPSGLGVSVLYSSASYPSSTTAPSNPGSYTVTATVTDSNYAGTATGTLVINSASSGLTLQLRTGMPEPSLYGTMAYFDLGLGSAPCPTGTVQFYVDGTASGAPVTLNGSSCSTPVTFQTATLEPGTHSVYAAYSGDSLHSAGNSNTVTHAVTADTTSVTLGASATSLNPGQSVTFTATVTPTSLDPSANGPAGTVEFFDGSTSLGVITLSTTSPYTAVFSTSALTVGPHSISASFVSSGGEFSGSSSSISVTVTAGKIAPTITWANPASIVYGTPLSGTQLNATAKDSTNGNIPVAGTFAYTPLAGTVPPVGTVNLSVTFTPTDTTTYSSQSATVTLTVTAATPTLSLTCAGATYDGNTHSCTGTATGVGGAAVSGNWSYSPATATAAGSYPVTGTFTSTDTNYQNGTATGTLKIDPAPVTATAGSYSAVDDGAAHAPTACAVTGAYTAGLSCTNNPASVGPGIGSGTVTPTVIGGNSNFAITLVNGSWSITGPGSTVTTVTCPASVIYNASAQTPCTATVTGGGGLNLSLTVSYSNNTNAGTATATASYPGDSTHLASSNSKTFTIAQANQTINFTQPASPLIYGVPNITLSATGGSSSMPVVFSIDASSSGSGTISGNALTVTGVGSLVINANQAGNSNYLAAPQVSRTIVVNLAPLTVAANNASRVYGTANPAFTGNVTGAVRSDVYTESFSTVATINSNVGTYPIVPSVTGANLSDYAVTVQNGILTITQAGTTTSLNASNSSVTPGQSVTLTAQVVSVTTGTPTGSVAFYNGASLLGTVPLSTGTATYSTSAFTPGSANALHAVYSGDNNFTTSSSSTTPVSVAALDFTVAISGSASATVNSGGTATYQMPVTPLYGNYPGPVSFSASGLPSGTSITFSPSTIAVDGGTKTVTVSIHTGTFAKLESQPIGSKLVPMTLAFLLIPLLGVGRLRRQGRRLSRLACLLLLLGSTVAGVTMTGCGGTASFKLTSQTDTISITATSGNVSHTTSVVLKVQ